MAEIIDTGNINDSDITLTGGDFSVIMDDTVIIMEALNASMEGALL